MQPLLSIVIPTYNRVDSLKTTIDSVLDQLNDTTKELVEVIVTDNDSSDGTKALLNNYKPKTLTINYNETNLGYINNFKIGMLKSSGKFVWLVGSDDELISGSINKILNVLSSPSELSLLFLNYYCLIPETIKFNSSNLKSNYKKKPYLSNVPEGLYDLKTFAGFNLDIFTAIYSFILKRDDWLSALDLYNHSKGNFDLSTNAYPHAFFIANRFKTEKLFYISQPMIKASYEIGWRKYLPICLLQYLPDLYDTWIQIGVSREIVREMKKRLIVECNHKMFVQEIAENNDINSYFSLFIYSKRFFLSPGFFSVFTTYVRVRFMRFLIVKWIYNKVKWFLL